MEGKTTFWELLNEYSVEIPVIQRDYAQGRDNVEDIRNNFLESIKEALDTRAGLDLNFVYGTVKGNVFTPIDGQQRLTTLFLLHVYIMIALGKKMDSGANKRIRKFTYETRTTSRDFCKNLVGETLVIRNSGQISDVIKISEEIKNNNWFSSSWKNDPTIKSMLTMLDSIHELFKTANLSDYYMLLTGNADDDCPLYFYFLDLGEYNLEDSIYIKLNARGKDLTCYENFKARLSKYITDEIDTPKDDYIAKLDGEWSDVFWAFREPETKLYDDKIMNLFMNYMINEYAAHMVTVGRDAVRAELRDVIGYSQLEFINRFHGYNAKWDGQKVADSFVDIFDLFDLMTDGKKQRLFADGNKYFEENQLFKWVIENNDTEKAESKLGISYTTRIQADAYFGFILNNRSEISKPEEFKEHLVKWMRVITTLSRETNYNGSDDYARAISKGVRRMLPNSYHILEYLSAIVDRSGYGFDADCFEEECIKAKLILKDDGWKDLILNAEANRYFNGQIGFLLEASGIIQKYENGEIDNWTPKEDNANKKAFKKYYEIYSSIFGEFNYGTKKEKYIGINRQFANNLRRALLCKGDFHLNDSSNSSFLIDFDRDISWKRLLRIQSSDKSGMYKKRREILLALINDPLFDAKDINQGLLNILSRDAGKIADWRKYFIKVPEIMDSLHDYSSYKPKERFIRFEGSNIFLMGSTRLYGYNDEYYSFALYCMLDNLNKYDLEYEQAKGWEDVHHQIKATDKKSGEIFEIKYNRSKERFVIYEKDGSATEYSTAEDVVAVMQ
ncbi:DUF262 domain-containing protein [Butyrivibrio sp. XBB1001]|uniref:DUF262 domain-containing protein n=1 Tax=Butyrivibrio sp. XBB1001 TaxID=1280682 RepID=UPI0004243917|nr:DUF262 domain-containing protein [Butyrivibrio sp. XBB1001]